MGANREFMALNAPGQHQQRLMQRKVKELYGMGSSSCDCKDESRSNVKNHKFSRARVAQKTTTESTRPLLMSFISIHKERHIH